MDIKNMNFVLPAALAVTTFVAVGACRQSTNDDNSDSESDDGSEYMYCEDIESMTACVADPGCGWDTQYDDCVNTCYQIEDEQECTDTGRCEWDMEGGTETGGAGFCHEPFT